MRGAFALIVIVAAPLVFTFDVFVVGYETAKGHSDGIAACVLAAVVVIAAFVATVLGEVAE